MEWNRIWNRIWKHLAATIDPALGALLRQGSWEAGQGQSSTDAWQALWGVHEGLRR